MKLTHDMRKKAFGTRAAWLAHCERYDLRVVFYQDGPYRQGGTAYDANNARIGAFTDYGAGRCDYWALAPAK